MQTGIARRPTDARNYVPGVAASLAFFGLIRLQWAAARLILPVTQLQAGLANRIFGTAGLPVDVTLACQWSRRPALSLGAIAAIRELAVTVDRPSAASCCCWHSITARIGTLARGGVAGLVQRAPPLCLVPAILTLVGVGYVFGWMRLADRPREPTNSSGPIISRASAKCCGRHGSSSRSPVAFVVIFIAASPLYLDNLASSRSPA